MSLFDEETSFEDFLKALAAENPEKTEDFVTRLGGWADAVDGKVVNPGKYGTVPAKEFLDARIGLHNTLVEFTPEQKNEFLIDLAKADFNLDMLTMFIRTAVMEMTKETAETLVANHLERIVNIPIFTDPMTELIGDDFLPEKPTEAEQQEEEFDKLEKSEWDTNAVIKTNEDGLVVTPTGETLPQAISDRLKEIARKKNVKIETI